MASASAQRTANAKPRVDCGLNRSAIEPTQSASGDAFVRRSGRRVSSGRGASPLPDMAARARMSRSYCVPVSRTSSGSSSMRWTGLNS
jgi:hypothetical protein